jgi:hypothetical protein
MGAYPDRVGNRRDARLSDSTQPSPTTISDGAASPCWLRIVAKIGSSSRRHTHGCSPFNDRVHP